MAHCECIWRLVDSLIFVVHVQYSGVEGLEFCNDLKCEGQYRLIRRGACPGVWATSLIQDGRLCQPHMTSMTRRVIRPLGVLLQQQQA